MPIYAIWKDERDSYVKDARTLVGYVQTDDYREADEIVAELNRRDEDVMERGFGGGYLYGYWKSEMTRITLKDVPEIVPH